MSYPDKLQDLVETLELVDRAGRIQLLIDIAERFQDVPEAVARRPYPEANKVPACESEAYVWVRRQPNGRPKFHFAVENPQGISAKAMAVILDDCLSGEDAKQIAEVNGDLVYEIFGRELSMGKSMGLMGMVSMVTLSAKKMVDEA